VVNCFGLPSQKLGKRQAAAPDVSEALTLSDPRLDVPAIAPLVAAGVTVMNRTDALATSILQAKARPLSSLQIKIMIGAAMRLGLPGDQQGVLAKSPTVFDADAELLTLEAQLVAKRAAKAL
jgi:hypothetical protein